MSCANRSAPARRRSTMSPCRSGRFAPCPDQEPNAGDRDIAARGTVNAFVKFCENKKAYLFCSGSRVGCFFCSQATRLPPQSLEKPKKFIGERSERHRTPAS